MPLEGLTPEQKALREGKLTGSRVAVLMDGDANGLLKLWEEMIGDPDAIEDDLSGNWNAQLGLATEELNLMWYEKKTGHTVSKKRQTIIHPKLDWACATLDGWDDVDKHPVEAKHVGGWESLETIIDRYQPQFHWQMMCTRSKRLVASIIEGTKEPTRELVEYNDDYAKELMKRAKAFMECVWDMREPVTVEPVPPPPPPTKVIDIKETSIANMWADHAATWLENVDARVKANDAEKELKKIMPADAGMAFGFGIYIKRNKAGALSVRKEGDK